MDSEDLKDIENDVNNLQEIIDDLNFSFEEDGLTEAAARDFCERIQLAVDDIVDDIETLTDFVKNNLDCFE